MARWVEQVIKAKPVPSTVYSGGPSVVHSNKPLTEPVSPHFRCPPCLARAQFSSPQPAGI